MKVGGCYDVRCWSNAGTLNDARHDFLEARGVLSELSAMRVTAEERFNPVVNVVRNDELGELVHDCTMTN